MALNNPFQTLINFTEIKHPITVVNLFKTLL